MEKKKKKTEEELLCMKMFSSSCVPRPQVPPACTPSVAGNWASPWTLGGLWLHRVLETLPGSSPLPDLGRGFACEQEGEGGWWAETSAPVALCAPWAAGRAFWGPLAAPPTDGWQAAPGRMLGLPGCRSAILSWEVMGAVHQITPLPSLVFVFVFLLYN